MLLMLFLLLSYVAHQHTSEFDLQISGSIDFMLLGQKSFNCFMSLVGIYHLGCYVYEYF